MTNTSQVIIHAARLGNVEVLEELIRQQANLNAQDEKGYTPLIIACYNNKYEAASLLIQSGADINAQDHGGNTALMGVVFKGYDDIAQLLIENGAQLHMEMVVQH